jgi:hypothetical protein
MHLYTSMHNIRHMGYYIDNNITFLFGLIGTCIYAVCRVISPSTAMQHYMVYELSFIRIAIVYAISRCYLKVIIALAQQLTCDFCIICKYLKIKSCDCLIDS